MSFVRKNIVRCVIIFKIFVLNIFCTDKVEDCILKIKTYYFNGVANIRRVCYLYVRCNLNTKDVLIDKNMFANVLGPFLEKEKDKDGVFVEINDPYFISVYSDYFDKKYKITKVSDDPLTYKIDTTPLKLSIDRGLTYTFLKNEYNINKLKYFRDIYLEINNKLVMNKDHNNILNLIDAKYKENIEKFTYLYNDLKKSFILNVDLNYYIPIDEININIDADVHEVLKELIKDIFLDKGLKKILEDKFISVDEKLKKIRDLKIDEGEISIVPQIKEGKIECTINIDNAIKSDDKLFKYLINLKKGYGDPKFILLTQLLDLKEDGMYHFNIYKTIRLHIYYNAGTKENYVDFFTKYEKVDDRLKTFNSFVKDGFNKNKMLECFNEHIKSNFIASYNTDELKYKNRFSDLIYYFICEKERFFYNFIKVLYSDNWFFKVDDKFFYLHKLFDSGYYEDIPFDYTSNTEFPVVEEYYKEISEIIKQKCVIIETKILNKFQEYLNNFKLPNFKKEDINGFILNSFLNAESYQEEVGKQVKEICSGRDVSYDEKIKMYPCLTKYFYKKSDNEFFLHHNKITLKIIRKLYNYWVEQMKEKINSININDVRKYQKKPDEFHKYLYADFKDNVIDLFINLKPTGSKIYLYDTYYKEISKYVGKILEVNDKYAATGFGFIFTYKTESNSLEFVNFLEFQIVLNNVLKNKIKGDFYTYYVKFDSKNIEQLREYVEKNEKFFNDFEEDMKKKYNIAKIEDNIKNELEVDEKYKNVLLKRYDELVTAENDKKLAEEKERLAKEASDKEAKIQIEAIDFLREISIKIDDVYKDLEKEVNALNNKDKCSKFDYNKLRKEYFELEIKKISDYDSKYKKYEKYIKGKDGEKNNNATIDSKVALLQSLYSSKCNEIFVVKINYTIKDEDKIIETVKNNIKTNLESKKSFDSRKKYKELFESNFADLKGYIVDVFYNDKSIKECDDEIKVDAITLTLVFKEDYKIKEKPKDDHEEDPEEDPEGKPKGDPNDDENKDKNKENENKNKEGNEGQDEVDQNSDIDKEKCCCGKCCDSCKPRNLEIIGDTDDETDTESVENED